MSHSPQARVSIIVPCYNEEDVLETFLTRLRSVTAPLRPYTFEFLFVDDGSTDDTRRLLETHAEDDPHVRVLVLSRNFGHQQAITAGLDFCEGDFAVIIDADLQDPPELIPEILAQLSDGVDLVHMVRADRNVDSLFKRLSAKAFYWLMRTCVLPELPEDAGDFKGFNRRVLVAVSEYRERVRFLRGIFASVGFKQAKIHYTRAARHAGSSKYPLWKVLRFAGDALFSFTLLPIRLLIMLGIVAGFGAIAMVVVMAVAGPPPVSNFVLGALVLACTSIILMGTGILGEYIGRMSQELKARPLYIIESTCNIDPLQVDARIAKSEGSLVTR